MPEMLSDLRKRFILISPLVIIGVGYLTAYLIEGWTGLWSWLPLALVFWGMTTLLIVTGGRKAWIMRWLSRPRRSWGWSILAMAVGFLPLPLLVIGPNGTTMAQWIPWAVFVVLNPWFEEGYWRGLLLDASSIWPAWLGILYSGVMFAVSYPLVWGTNFPEGRTPGLILSALAAGILWGVVYWRTGSLRWVVVGHLLFDVFSLAAPVLWNLYLPS